MLFISLQWKTEIAETLASSAPSCLGDKACSDSSQERGSQVKAGLSLHWDARVWQDLGSSEMSLCAQGSAAELRATVPSSPFPCRAVLLNTLQFSPNPLLAVLLSHRGAGRKHPRELSQCLDGAWCLPVCVWSVGSQGLPALPCSHGGPHLAATHEEVPCGTAALDKAVCSVLPQRQAPRRQIIP